MDPHTSLTQKTSQLPVFGHRHSVANYQAVVSSTFQPQFQLWNTHSTELFYHLLYTVLLSEEASVSCPVYPVSCIYYSIDDATGPKALHQLHSAVVPHCSSNCPQSHTSLRKQATLSPLTNSTRHHFSCTWKWPRSLSPFPLTYHHASQGAWRLAG